MCMSTVSREWAYVMTSLTTWLWVLPRQSLVSTSHSHIRIDFAANASRTVKS